MKLTLLLPLLVVLLAGTLITARAEAPQDAELVATRYGLALHSGTAYAPHGIPLTLVSGFALLDYDRVWWHRAPDLLRLRLEASLGATGDGRQRLLGSLNMLALHYLGHWSGPRLRPYVEAGIGLIYTDFQVKNQGLRINFNPQLGAGLELELPRQGTLAAGIRLHHISNGGLHHDNRGINSVLLQIARYF